MGGRKNRKGRRRPDAPALPTIVAWVNPAIQLPLELDGRCSGPLFGPARIRKLPNKKRRGELYRKRLKRATPKWADRAAIKRLYEEAKVMTRATGLRHTVDHVIPLRGETVCGLHVHNNLQVILHEDNVRKGNSFVDQLDLW